MLLLEEPVRINVRVPADINEWLDQESKRTAVPKSSLVYMMIDKYITDKKAVDSMHGMPALFNQLNDMQKKDE